MENNFNHINEYTLLKYIRGECSQEEKEEIKSWAGKNSENEKMLNELRRVWEHSSSLSDFGNFNPEEDWQKVKSKINFNPALVITKSKSSGYGLPFYLRIAAGITVVMVAIYLLIGNLDQKQKLITGFTTNDQKEIVLSDGSLVILNENSEILYPEDFVENKREVRLKGEAFFEVTKDAKKPFIINTSKNASIKVLGTSFNVDVNKIDEVVVVHVVDGKVALYDSNDEEHNVILGKNEKGIIDHGILSKSTFNEMNFLSWKTGFLKFENTALSEVIKDLTKYYKKPIRLANQEIAPYKITTTIDNQPLDEVLEEIKLILDLNYMIDNDTITIYKTRNKIE